MCAEHAVPPSVAANFRLPPANVEIASATAVVETNAAPETKSARRWRIVRELVAHQPTRDSSEVSPSRARVTSLARPVSGSTQRASHTVPVTRTRRSSFTPGCEVRVRGRGFSVVSM